MRVTIDEFYLGFDALGQKASHAPVIITKDGSDFLVVMSAAEWQRLRRRDRQVGLTEELGEEWVRAART